MIVSRQVPAKGLFFIAALLVFCASACATFPPAHPDPSIEAVYDRLPEGAREHIRDAASFLPRRMEWRKIAHGIELLEWRVLEQRVHNVVIRIDLANPALDIIAYPDNIDGGVFAAKKPEDFARETGAAVVINATPFSLPSGVLSKNRSLSGIYRVGKHELSAPVARYAALGFLADNSAFVVRSQADSIPESARLVAGGFFCILENGAVVPMKAASLDARMAAGVSPDKKTLFILCVEGNGGLFPRGMSYEECAIVLSCLGASDALQFDGGSSVALVAGGAILAGRFGRTPANLLGFVISVP